MQHPGSREGNEEPPRDPVAHGSSGCRKEADREKGQDGLEVVVVRAPYSLYLLIRLARGLSSERVILWRDEHPTQIPEDGRRKTRNRHLENENRRTDDEQAHRRVGKAHAHRDASLRLQKDINWRTRPAQVPWSSGSRGRPGIFLRGPPAQRRGSSASAVAVAVTSSR